MDFDGAADNMMTAFISFPQVLGHEVVGTLEQLGPGRRPTSRWASGSCCTPTSAAGPGASRPVCPACERGDYSICQRWWEGDLPAGHPLGQLGGCHRRLRRARARAPLDGLLRCPTRCPTSWPCLPTPGRSASTPSPATRPEPGRRVVVYGAGALGCHGDRHPRPSSTTARSAVVARWRGPGRDWPAPGGRTWSHGGPDDGEAVVEALADWSGRPAARAVGGPSRWPTPAASTSSTTPSGRPSPWRSGMRVLAERGTLVQLGVGRTGTLRVDTLVLQGAAARGVQRLRDGDLRGTPRPRLRALLRPHRRRPRRPVGHADPHLAACEGWRDAFTTIVDAGDDASRSRSPSTSGEHRLVRFPTTGPRPSRPSCRCNQLR